MNRKIWFVVGIVSMLSAIPLWLSITSRFERIALSTNLLSPDKHVLYRDLIAQEIQTLTGENIVLWIALTIALLFGGLCLIMPNLPPKIATSISRPRKLLSVMALASLLFLIPIASTENIYYRPRITMDKTITLPSYGQRTYDSIFTTMAVTRGSIFNGWVAYLLAVGNPVTKEFIEVGYFQDAGGFKVYSSCEIKGVYRQVDFATSEGCTYHFAVYSVGTSAHVEVDGSTLNSVTFSNADTLDCAVQGETLYPSNGMLNTFSEIEAGYWAYVVDICGNGSTVEGFVHLTEKWHVDQIEVVSEPPYAMSYTSASPYINTATVMGGLFPPQRGDSTAQPNRFGGGGSVPRPK